MKAKNIFTLIALTFITSSTLAFDSTYSVKGSTRDQIDTGSLTLSLDKATVINITQALSFGDNTIGRLEPSQFDLSLSINGRTYKMDGSLRVEASLRNQCEEHITFIPYDYNDTYINGGVPGENARFWSFDAVFERENCQVATQAITNGNLSDMLIQANSHYNYNVSTFDLSNSQDQWFFEVTEIENREIKNDGASIVNINASTFKIDQFRIQESINNANRIFSIDTALKNNSYHYNRIKVDSSIVWPNGAITDADYTTGNGNIETIYPNSYAQMATQAAVPRSLPSGTYMLVINYSSGVDSHMASPFPEVAQRIHEFTIQ